MQVKRVLKNEILIFFYSIKMSGKTLKFDNIEINKNKFYASKQSNNLDLVDTNKTVISDKFKHRDDGFKYFIGYRDDSIIRPFCIILPQMSGYIKYFENGRKNKSFVIEDDRVLFKNSDVWNKTKEINGIKFYSNPVYDDKYIIAKVREYNGVIKINFLGNEVSKEGVHYICIACINIDSVMKMDTKPVFLQN